MTQSRFAKKTKYQPNISRYLALCGRNYINILRWLPQISFKGDIWQIQGEYGRLNVRLLEDTPYTQVINISRNINVNPLSLEKMNRVNSSELLAIPHISVRIFHDAQLAEVLTSQQISQLRPVYDYPNVEMHHEDEKYRVNAFLEELLKIGGLIKTVC
ncbi:DUF1249 domain-containing protein [Shewanella surugensis]|uniref:DUF1249 domain-containing protein n=1 Tax=Shewanella surugensis TaxID=212020 RepID=A0ABT0LFE0_9GAMM|nr:DUF1249 domain-containing protein [Shewanella surugensis]MCL1126427.1 DUF1249 domain-containing protein [Shewanella surugensis]